MGSQMHTTIGPAIEKPMDMLHILERVNTNDVLFLDEVHRLPPTVEELMYPVLEESRVDFLLNDKLFNCPLPKFTVVGATTMAGRLSAPFRNRFGLTARLEYYPPEDLAKILVRSALILKVDIDAAGLLNIAKRARGTPRIANTLLRRVRDFAGGRRVNGGMLTATFDLEGINEEGLGMLDQMYLACLRDKFKGGPAGVRAIASTMNESVDTLEEVVEGYLLYIGKIARTPRGRMLL